MIDPMTNEPDPGQPRATPTPLHRNRDWNLLMTGATVSAVGTAMTGLAFLMLAYSITNSSAKAGLAAAAVALGEFIMMLPAGALVDRWDRKKTMVGTAAMGALVFATIPVAAWLGHLTYPHLLLVALAEGMLGCFYGPAERGALKRIVPDEQMGTAMSATMARSSFGSLIGPPLSGALYGISRTLPMVGDAIGFAWAAGCAALVRTPLPAPERSEPTPMLTDIRQGLSWVWRTTAVRDIALVALMINLGLNGAMSTAILALQRAGTSPSHLGLLESAIGAAGLVGALVAPAIVARAHVGRMTVFGMIVASVLGAALVANPSIWWIGAVMSTVLLVAMPLNAGISAYQMHVTPDEMQGRAATAIGFLAMALMPLASSGAGFGLEHLGRVPTMLAFAGILGLGALGAIASRPIRGIPRTADFTAHAEA